MGKDFLKELESIIGEAEKETAFETEVKPGIKTESNVVLRRDALKKERPASNIHSGHRERMKNSDDCDPDFITFSDVQLLEYLLFNTIPRVDTNEFAHFLIDSFGSFSGVLNANIAELKTASFKSPVSGRTYTVSEETARMLTSILPAARKSEMSRLRNNYRVTNTVSAVNYMQPFFMNRTLEYIYMTTLNNSDGVISVDLISIGDTNFTTVDVKKIIETACRHKASKVLIAHNHPSGNIEPSREDREMTARLSISLLGINVILIDHLIFTADGYYSFFASREFESIYTYADKIFKTHLMHEIESKQKNYRAGIYPSGFEADIYEAADDAELEDGCYALGHPDARSLKING
jgi:DNA repair protein RadC